MSACMWHACVPCDACVPMCIRSCMKQCMHACVCAYVAGRVREMGAMFRHADKFQGAGLETWNVRPLLIHHHCYRRPPPPPAAAGGCRGWWGLVSSCPGTNGSVDASVWDWDRAMAWHNWDGRGQVSSCVDMNFLFSYALCFSANLSLWRVNSVTDMYTHACTHMLRSRGLRVQNSVSAIGALWETWQGAYV